MAQINAVHTDDAPAAIGPYSQAMVSDGWIFASGQIPIDPVSGAVSDGDAAAQAEVVLANLRAVLEAAGGAMDTVVKATVYLTDMADFAAVNEVYARHFADHAPARVTVQVAGLPRGVDVEIDAVARTR